MKYEITKDTKESFGRTLHRIVCVTAFSNIAIGEVGGWVETEANLSQDGDAWVSDDASVIGNARVSGNASVIAKAYRDSQLSGDCFKAAVEFIGQIKEAKKKALMDDK